MLAFAMMAAIRCRANSDGAAPEKTPDDMAVENVDLIRWSVQEVRRIAARLASCRIWPAYIIAWSNRRRAHQAATMDAHIKKLVQLYC